MLTSLFLINGCATTAPEHHADDNTREAAALYSDATESMKAKDYEMAITHLESLDIQYPFSDLAKQAQLDIIYAYYKHEEPESAISAAGRFIKLQPRHPNIDYAYYLRGLTRFEQTHSGLDRFLKRDPALRDPRPAQDAFGYFSELISRFPNSQYAVDARQRMIYLRDYLARHELYVARYYMDRDAYIAVINRSKYMLEHFDETSVIPDALKLMHRAYLELGLHELAEQTMHIIKHQNNAEQS